MEKCERIYVRDEDMSYAYEPGIDTVGYIRDDIAEQKLKELRERVKELEDENDMLESQVTRMTCHMKH